MRSQLWAEGQARLEIDSTSQYSQGKELSFCQGGRWFCERLAIISEDGDSFCLSRRHLHSSETPLQFFFFTICILLST